MAEPITERLQPCLFDRLTDEDPATKQDSRASRVISLPKYREGVLRDLRWVLNSSAHVGEDELNLFGEVRRSVLNFGIRDLCGQLASSLELAAVEHQLIEAIKFFEPRIIASSLSVKALGETDKSGPNSLAFEIRGELWALPMPEQLLIKTQIDLDTGQCVI